MSGRSYEREYIRKPTKEIQSSRPHYWYATKRGSTDTLFRCQCGLVMLGEDLYQQPVPEEKNVWPI